MRAKFTERTVLALDYQAHSGQMVDVKPSAKHKRVYDIRTDDGWTGEAYLHELSECSPELNLLLAKQRILGEAL